MDDLDALIEEWAQTDPQIHERINAALQRRSSITTTWCRTCEEGLCWIECPTGGWWRHFEHPGDEHDADAPLLPESAE